MSMANDFPTITTKELGPFLVKAQKSFGVKVGSTLKLIELLEPAFVYA